MKVKFSLSIILLSVLFTSGNSQDKTKKELKDIRRQESEKQVETMINAKEFEFNARTALPTGMKSLNLSTNPNYVKFQPDMIDGFLPYFGKAYSSAGFGGDNGLKFQSKPEEFNVVKKKKNYLITVNVKTDKDYFRLSLTVGFEGTATLSVISNNRSSISYQGEISALGKSDK